VESLRATGPRPFPASQAWSGLAPRRGHIRLSASAGSGDASDLGLFVARSAPACGQIGDAGRVSGPRCAARLPSPCALSRGRGGGLRSLGRGRRAPVIGLSGADV